MKKLLFTGLMSVSLLVVAAEDKKKLESVEFIIPASLSVYQGDQPKPQNFINFENTSLPQGKGVFIDGAILAITEGEWIYHNKPAFSKLVLIDSNAIIIAYYFVPEAIFKKLNIFSFMHCYYPAYGYPFSHNKNASLYARLGAKLSDYVHPEEEGEITYFENKAFEGQCFGNIIPLYMTPDYAEELLIQSGINVDVLQHRQTFASTTLEYYYCLCQRSDGFTSFNGDALLSYLKNAFKDDEKAQQIMDSTYLFMPKKERIYHNIEGKEEFRTEIIKILNRDYFKLLELSGDTEKLAKERQRIDKAMHGYNFKQFFSKALTQRAAYAVSLDLISKEKFEHIHSTLNPKFVFEGDFAHMNPELDQKDIDDLPTFDALQAKALAGSVKDQETLQSYNAALESVLLLGQSLYCIYDQEKGIWAHDTSARDSVININESESLALDGFLQGHGLLLTSLILGKSIMYYIARLTYEHTLTKHRDLFNPEYFFYLATAETPEDATTAGQALLEQIRERYVVPCKTTLFEALLKKGGSAASDVKEYLEQKIAAHESDNAALCAQKMLDLYNNLHVEQSNKF